MSMKTMVTILTAVMLAAVLTMSVASAKDHNCKALCEKSLKCPNAEKGATVKECIKGCKAMKENLRKELADALLTCAEASMCKSEEEAGACQKKAMTAMMTKLQTPVKGADKIIPAYCDKMMSCMSQAGAVPPAQLTAMKGQCLQNMQMMGFDKLLSKKGVERFTACMTTANCEQMSACLADIFGATMEQ